MQHISSQTTKKSNRQSKLFSWIFSNHSSSPSATKDELNTKTKDESSNKVELTLNEYSLPVDCSIYDSKIPNRRQSKTYISTDNSDTISLDNYQYKRRSYLPSTHNESSSSLTRSATWQPSTSQKNNNTPHVDSLNVDDIPTRRTSRNYSDNPEIQAKLNAVLNSDRVSHIMQQRSPLSKPN